MNILLVENIPRKFHASEFLSLFYERFGVVVKVEMKLNNSAEVTFVNQSDALEACQKGAKLDEEGAEVTLSLASTLKKTTDTQPPQPQKIFKPRPSFVKFKNSLDALAQKLKSIPCQDANAKFTALDKIDKSVRKGLKTGEKKKHAVQGSCMDMCPEKERYMRIDRNQVSPYEQRSPGDNEMDHRKAVKEYSRSSADQDEPLPHELRPPTVLQITMNYLIRNFMHEELSGRSDWFDFLWNRTRAIRKDITQQNLKCEDAIDLIEKCARFHILCSHQLCEQEMHIFDAKINLENLTKCLQTLKHMYEDAKGDAVRMIGELVSYMKTYMLCSMKKNIKCKNEAEFRCYQILLNLNNTDTLREVTEFSVEVRTSAPVKFAIAVCSAVHEKNYVRFFKLLRHSSFLCGCLMHPYFTQIRSVALRLMARSFTVPKSDIPYPLERMQDVLAFDDVTGVQEFCTFYGFNVDEKNVYLNRMGYMEPEEKYTILKSYLISGKCADTFAEVINGDDLPANHKYEPTNSFDVHNFYIGSYHIIDDSLYDSEALEIDENILEDLIKPSAQPEKCTSQDVDVKNQIFDSKNIRASTQPSSLSTAPSIFSGNNNANANPFFSKPSTIGESTVDKGLANIKPDANVFGRSSFGSNNIFQPSASTTSATTINPFLSGGISSSVTTTTNVFKTTGDSYNQFKSQPTSGLFMSDAGVTADTLFGKDDNKSTNIFASNDTKRNLFGPSDSSSNIFTSNKIVPTMSKPNEIKPDPFSITTTTTENQNLFTTDDNFLETNIFATSDTVLSNNIFQAEKTAPAESNLFLSSDSTSYASSTFKQTDDNHSFQGFSRMTKSSNSLGNTANVFKPAGFPTMHKQYDTSTDDFSEDPGLFTSFETSVSESQSFDQVDNPFIKHVAADTRSTDLRAKLDTRSPVDLRAKLNAKRKQTVADPDYFVTQDDVEDAQEDNEDDEERIDEVQAHIMFLREDISSYGNELIENHIDEVKHDILSEVFTEIKQEKKEVENACKVMLALFCIEEARAVTSEVVTEERSKNERQKSLRLEIDAQNTCDEMVAQHTIVLLKDCCGEVYGEETDKSANAQRVAQSLTYRDEIIRDVITEEVKSLCSTTLDETLSQRKSTLITLLNEYKRRKLHRAFSRKKELHKTLTSKFRWVKVFKYRMFIKSTLQDFPTQPSYTTAGQALHRLDANLSRTLFVNNSTVITKHESLSKLDVSLKQHISRLQLFRKEIECPLPVDVMFKQALSEKNGNYWKHGQNDFHNVIVCNSANDTNLDSPFAAGDVVVRKIKKYRVQQDYDGPTIYRCSLRSHNDVTHHLTIKTADAMGEDTQTTFYGMSALLFIVDVPPLVPTNFWQSQAERLLDILHKHPIPVCILLCSRAPHNPAVIARQLNLQCLNTPWSLTLLITNTLNSAQINSQIESSISWLFKESIPTKEIVTKSLAAYIEDAMATHFFQSFHECGLYCSKLGLPAAQAEDVITLFNNTLQSIQEAILRSAPVNNQRIDPDTDLVNTSRRLYELGKLVTVLELPEIPNCDEDDWEQSYACCLQYVRKLTGSSSSILMNRITVMLEKLMCEVTSFPWMDVLELCIINRLSVMYSPLPDHDPSTVSYSSPVHDVDGGMPVKKNPLEAHMRIMNESSFLLQESGDCINVLKRRKYHREQSLRDSLTNIDLELLKIEEKTLRRKSSPRRRSGNDDHLPLKNLVLETSELCSNITNEKEKTFSFNLMSDLDLISEERATYPQEPPPLTKNNILRLDDSNKSFDTTISDCCTSIHETRLESNKTLKYWQSKLLEQ